MSKKGKERVTLVADPIEEQSQQGPQLQATTQDNMVYVYPPATPYPRIIITEEAVAAAAKKLDDGYIPHPGWVAAFRFGLEYAERKEREAAQRVEEAIEGSANGQA